MSNNFYSSIEWMELRYKALLLYGRKCQCCGQKPPSVVLHCDHIKPRSKFPALALDINNLQILCEACNKGKSNKYDSDFRFDCSADEDYLNNDDETHEAIERKIMILLKWERRQELTVKGKEQLKELLSGGRYRRDNPK